MDKNSSELDEFDLKILSVLQEDAALSTQEVADRVGLSQSPCWRRIRRLEEEGIIRGRTAIVDRQSLGFDLQFFVQVKLRPPTPTTLAALESEVQKISRVQECYKVFGEGDFLLKIIARSIEDYETHVYSRIARIPGIWDLTTVMVMTEVKSSTIVPVGPGQAGPRETIPSAHSDDGVPPYIPRIASP